MVSLLIIGVGVAVGLLFFRTKTKKILLVVALSIAAGGAYRLFEMAGRDEAIWPAILVLSALGAVWLVSWLLNRSVSRKQPRKVTVKSRTGPPRVGVR